MAAVLKSRTHGHCRGRFLGRMDDVDGEDHRDHYGALGPVL